MLQFVKRDMSFITFMTEDEFLDPWTGPKGCRFRQREQGGHSSRERSDVTTTQQIPVLLWP